MMRWGGMGLWPRKHRPGERWCWDNVAVGFWWGMIAWAMRS